MTGFLLDTEEYFTTLVNRLGLEAGDHVRTLFIRFNQGVRVRIIKYLGDSMFSYEFYPIHRGLGVTNTWCFSKEESNDLAVTNVSKMFNLVRPYDPFYTPSGNEIMVNVDSIYGHY